MNLLSTTIYKGQKHLVVGKNLFSCASIQFVELSLYGFPLHTQQRIRVTLSELERDSMGEVSGGLNTGVNSSISSRDEFTGATPVAAASPANFQFDENLGGYICQPNPKPYLAVNNVEAV